MREQEEDVNNSESTNVQHVSLDEKASVDTDNGDSKLSEEDASSSPENKLDEVMNIDEEALKEAIMEETDAKPQTKGFFSTMGGWAAHYSGYNYFTRSKSVEEADAEKLSEDDRVPREFQMQPSNTDSEELDVNKKQNIDFKDQSEIIQEESEDLPLNENENDSDLKTIEETPETESNDQEEKTETCNTDVSVPAEKETLSQICEGLKETLNQRKEIVPDCETKESLPVGDQSNNNDVAPTTPNQEWKSQILDGSDKILTIINDLLTILDQLSKSVGSQQSICCMKEELEHYREESQKITEDAETDCLSEEKAAKINKSLSSVVSDVMNYIQESKDLSDESKSSSVSSQEFEKLLVDCQELATSLDTFGKDCLKTHESSPDEFLSANEAMSASASFSEQKERKKSHDDADSPRDKFVCDTNKIEEETSEGENFPKNVDCKEITATNKNHKHLQLSILHIFYTICFMTDLRET